MTCEAAFPSILTGWHYSAYLLLQLFEETV